jgi:hypothetical protein
MSEVDELVADAQDALFENDLDRAVSVAEQVLRTAPRENDAHEVVVLAHAARGAFEQQRAAVQRWCHTKGSNLPLKLQKHALESAFLVDDRGALTDLARSLIAVRSVSESDERWFSTLCVSAALMCADCGEVELAQLLQERLGASGSAEDALLQSLVIAWLTGVTDRGTADKLLRALADDSRSDRELAYVAAWAESMRLLLAERDSDDTDAADVTFAEELIASNISGALTLQAAVALASGDVARIDQLRARHESQGSFGNVHPLVRRRIVLRSSKRRP